MERYGRGRHHNCKKRLLEGPIKKTALVSQTPSAFLGLLAVAFLDSLGKTGTSTNEVQGRHMAGHSER